MSFNTHFFIGNRRVGPGEPVLIIAEAGVNHFGDKKKALKLVDLATDSGADIFKTQAFNSDNLISSMLPEWRKRLRSKEVGFDFIASMKKRCDERGIQFMCTAHDNSVLPWLDELDVPHIKLGQVSEIIRPIFEQLLPVGNLLLCQQVCIP